MKEEDSKKPEKEKSRLEKGQEEDKEFTKSFNKFFSAEIDPKKEGEDEMGPVSCSRKPYFPSLYLDDQIVPKDFNKTPGDMITISAKCKVKRVSMDDDKDEGKSVDLEIKEICFEE